MLSTEAKGEKVIIYNNSCIDVNFIFDSVRLGLSSSVNILQVVFLLFLLFLAIILLCSSCSSYSWKEWSVRHFSFHNENNSTLSQGLLGELCINL